MITSKTCSSGNPRIPLDLFDNYTTLKSRKPTELGKQDLTVEFSLKDGHSLSDINFPIHLYTKRELIEVVILIFEKYSGIETLKTDKQTLR